MQIDGFNNEEMSSKPLSNLIPSVHSNLANVNRNAEADKQDTFDDLKNPQKRSYPSFHQSKEFKEILKASKVDNLPGLADPLTIVAKGDVVSVGIDCGSTCLKCAVRNVKGELVCAAYMKHDAQAVPKTMALLNAILDKFENQKITNIRITGTATLAFTKQVNKIMQRLVMADPAERESTQHREITPVNELGAQADLVRELPNRPGKVHIFEIGGQDSKAISVNTDDSKQESANEKCSGGTGRFVEYVTERIGYDSLDDLIREGLNFFKNNPNAKIPDVSAKCSVMAKKDVVTYLAGVKGQFNGTEAEKKAAIAIGVHLAVARNFLRNLTSDVFDGLSKDDVIMLQGGAAKNPLLAAAFWITIKEMYPNIELASHQFLVAEHAQIQVVKGAARVPKQNDPGFDTKLLKQALAEMERELAKPKVVTRLPRLVPSEADKKAMKATGAAKEMSSFSKDGTKTDVILGIDGGSTGFKLVLVGFDTKKVLYKKTVRSEGTVADLLNQEIHRLNDDLGEKINILDVAITGASRDLIASILRRGMDASPHVEDEINSHGWAAGELYPDTKRMVVLEMGGNDRKAMVLNDGIPMYSYTNKDCGAGTGAFFEQVAKNLGISVSEIGPLAFESRNPLEIKAKCTVFSEQNIRNHQNQLGDKTEQNQDIAAGVSYSGADQLLEILPRRFKDKPKAGQKYLYLFQGGPAAHIRSIRAALRQRLHNQNVIVPEYAEHMGALGAALIALSRCQKSIDQLAKAELTDKSPKQHLKTRLHRFCQNFVPDEAGKLGQCKKCGIECELGYVKFKGENSKHITGASCDRYNTSIPDDQKRLSQRGEDPFKIRTRLLLGQSDSSTKSKNLSKHRGESDTKRSEDGPSVIGYPAAIHFWDLFPYFKTFFEKCGYRLIPSEMNRDKLLKLADRRGVSDGQCLETALMIGAVEDLEQRGVDYIFIPSIVSLPKVSREQFCAEYCLTARTMKNGIRGAFDALDVKIKRKGTKFLDGELNFNGLGWTLPGQLQSFLGKTLGLSRYATIAAHLKAKKAQKAFEIAEYLEGKCILSEIEKSGGKKKGFVLIGPNYLTNDGANKGIARMIRQTGHESIPMSFLPLKEACLDPVDYRETTAHREAQVRAAFKFAQEHPYLNAVVVGSDMCVNDGYFIKRLEQMSEETNKPFLHLTVDESGSDENLKMRITSFIRSLTLREERLRDAQGNIPKPGNVKPKSKMKFVKRAELRQLKAILIPQLVEDPLLLKNTIENATKMKNIYPIDETKYSYTNTLEAYSYSNGSECGAYRMFLGGMLAAVREQVEKGIKPSEIATAFWDQSCAAHGMRKAMEDALHEAGYDGIKVLCLNMILLKPTTDNHVRYSFPLWRKIITAGAIRDYMRDILFEVRPYEVENEDSDAKKKTIILEERKARMKQNYLQDFMPEVNVDDPQTLDGIKLSDLTYERNLRLIAEAAGRPKALTKQLYRYVEEMVGTKTLEKRMVANGHRSIIMSRAKEHRGIEREMECISGIHVDRSKRRPLIYVIGGLAQWKYTSGDIARHIEDMGCEVRFTPGSEWYYGQWEDMRPVKDNSNLISRVLMSALYRLATGWMRQLDDEVYGVLRYGIRNSGHHRGVDADKTYEYESETGGTVPKGKLVVNHLWFKRAMEMGDGAVFLWPIGCQADSGARYIVDRLAKQNPDFPIAQISVNDGMEKDTSAMIIRLRTIKEGAEKHAAKRFEEKELAAREGSMGPYKGKQIIGYANKLLRKQNCSEKKIA